VRKRTAIPLTVVGASVVALLLIELGLRVAGASYPSFYWTDPRRGSALRPGAEGLFSQEGRAWIRINEHGMRDRARRVAKPLGAFRVALLGDSYTEALQVPLEQTFGAVLERTLSECPPLEGRPIEVLNFGVSGYGTTQELLTYVDRARAFDPDVVLLAFLPGNDVRDNSKALSPSRMRPFHMLDGDQLELDDSFLHSESYARRTSAMWKLGHRLIDHSRLMQLLNQAKNKRAAAREQRELQATSRSQGLGELGLDDFVLREPTTAEQRDAWEITERVLLMLRDAVREDGSDLLLATLSFGAQVDPDPGSRDALKAALGVGDLFYAERRLSGFAARHDISVLALGPRLLAWASHHGTQVHGFGDNLGQGHWNAAGHRVAGLLLAVEICGGLTSGKGAGEPPLPTASAGATLTPPR
jgi:hypothetical protein